MVAPQDNLLTIIWRCLLWTCWDFSNAYYDNKLMMLCQYFVCANSLLTTPSRSQVSQANHSAEQGSEPVASWGIYIHCHFLETSRVPKRLVWVNSPPDKWASKGARSWSICSFRNCGLLVSYEYQKKNQYTIADFFLILVSKLNAFLCSRGSVKPNHSFKAKHIIYIQQV